MKMTKRIISLLLCALMVLTLAPVSAFAADTKIDSVTITGVKNPVAGEKKSDASYTTATVDGAAPYTVQSVSWWSGGGSWLGDPGFVQGKSYTASIILEPKAGYKFDQSVPTTVKINGETGTLEAVNTDGTAEVSMVFATEGTGIVTLSAKSLYYDNINLSAGSNVPTTFPVYSESTRYNYKAQGIAFCENGTPVTSGKIEDGKTYTLDVLFTADEHCKFAESGYKALLLDYDIYGEMIANTGNTVTFRFTIGAKEEINKAEIYFTDARIGEPLLLSYALPANSPIEVLSTYWEYTKGGVEYTYNEDSTEDVYAEAGVEYTFVAYIAPKEGYSFPTDDSKLTFKMNGKTIRRFSHGGAKRWGYRTTALANTVITQLSATVAEPVFGEAPSMVATTTGTGYTVSVDCWYDEVTGEDATVFLAGKQYTVQIEFLPEEGYAFPLNWEDELSAIINGKEAEVYSYDMADRSVNFGLTYTIPAVEIDSVEIKGFPAPEVGQTVKEFYDFWNGKVADGSVTVNGEKHDSENYCFGDLFEDEWYLYDKDKEHLHYIDDANTVITEGTYYLDILLYTKNGEVFTDDLTVTVPGAKSVEVSRSDDEICVYAKYEVKKPAPKVNPFKDVSKKDYFYDAVLWAVDEGVTTGTSKTTFGPAEPCTRAQAVTFLWRAAGCPASGTTKNPFTDVKKSDYYYKAVLWASGSGVTSGTSATTFSPNDPCTRGQIVTFLWRAQSGKKVSATNPFKDVKKSDYYYNAVLWAVKNNVTTGTAKDAFSPNATCTRGQIVTFLYRAYNNLLD